MHLVIDRLIEVVTATGGISVPAGNLGPKRPSSGDEIPAVSASLTLETEKSPALGRFVRSGDSPTKSTSVVEVKASLETFSVGLKSLRISPLPLRKNPASARKEFAADDLQIRNVTNPANPAQYLMTENPLRKEEFRVDAARAVVVFGAAQTEGEKLEVTHWTVAWRDEILADRFIGLMALEMWANSFNEVDGITRKLQEALRSNRVLLRAKGFLKLQPFSLGAAERLLLEPPTGSAFPAWRQNLAYKFVFEAEDGGELSAGIPIKQVNVEMDDHVVETFSIR